MDLWQYGYIYYYMERSSSEQMPRSRKFGETELSQKGTASAAYGTVAVLWQFTLAGLFVVSTTEICNHRCHAATRFSRRWIVARHMDCPDNLECWWSNKATRLKRSQNIQYQ